MCGFREADCFTMWSGASSLDLQAEEGQRKAETSNFYSQIVVTRSGEDLRWLNALAGISAVVYNRGGLDSLLPSPRENLKVVKSENTGREDDSMMRHIVENYEVLPNITVFVQGWPFEHCPGLLDTLPRTLAAMQNPEQEQSGPGGDGLVPLSTQFWQYSMSKRLIGLAKELVESHSAADDPDPSYSAEVLYEETCKSILGTCPETQWVTEGAQWAVTRERILKFPKSSYVRALALGEGYEHKWRGLVLEALWPELWGAPNWEPQNVQYFPVAFDSLSHAIAGGQYCATPDGDQRELHSCQDRLAYCELRQRSSQAAYSAEQVSDNWSMMAEMKPFLSGASTWSPLSGSSKPFAPILVKAGKPDGEFGLKADDAPHGLAWNITQGQVKNENVFYFATPSDNSTSGWRYLACGIDGLTSLVDVKVPWTVGSWSGQHRLISLSGEVLSLRRSDNGWLSCVPEDALKLDESTFLLDLISTTV